MGLLGFIAFMIWATVARVDENVIKRVSIRAAKHLKSHLRKYLLVEGKSTI